MSRILLAFAGVGVLLFLLLPARGEGQLAAVVTTPLYKT